MLAALLAWIVGVNLWTMLRFQEDKRRAAAGARRIPEARLLRLALLGGTPGALAARRLFRHKTRKQPFSTQLLLIAAVQLAVAIGLLVLWLGK
ncbi:MULTISPECIES: DUF1294 domain-containing protein [unclassified Sphingomonas]|jgi:uncharacterized membrane protein YsdA (DUF1294 family)|uniref:DUF1294 domain-containing protein n=1 Tax=unclassified Sphingomonas TaxID=196159 RepID=UPI000A931AF5|nr:MULTISPECIES: DUF1294 domain-containing protein [unclassified Sphingomonas]